MLAGGTMLRKPLFEHHEYPDHFAVVAGMLVQFGLEQIIDEARLDPAAITYRFERTKGQLMERGVIGDPAAEGQAEAVFFLLDDFQTQKIAQRFFEEIAQLRAVQLVLRRQSQRKIDEFVINQREGGPDAGKRAGRDHFAQIVVGQRVFPVIREHAVDERA